MNEQLELALCGTLAELTRTHQAFSVGAAALAIVEQPVAASVLRAKADGTVEAIQAIVSLLPAIGVEFQELGITEEGVSLRYVEGRMYELEAKRDAAAKKPDAIPMPPPSVDDELPAYWPIVACETCGWTGRRMAGSPAPCPGAREVFRQSDGAAIGWDHEFTPAE